MTWSKVTVAHLFGLSTQSPGYQREAAGRLHLAFGLSSDEHLTMTTAMGLPTFHTVGTTLLERFRLVMDNGRIVHIFYPVFPRDGNATDVMTSLRGDGVWSTSGPGLP